MAVERATRVLLVGTTLQTSLPQRVAMIAARRGIPVDRVDPYEDPFAESGISAEGTFYKEPATAAIPRLARALWAMRT
ncbi:MAG: hypothetical protein IPK60_15680 [Sandaracinaceae bacterium]|nr:hypothetical protein [Sandaracinaceae bacterium]